MAVTMTAIRSPMSIDIEGIVMTFVDDGGRYVDAFVVLPERNVMKVQLNCFVHLSHTLMGFRVTELPFVYFSLSL